MSPPPIVTLHDEPAGPLAAEVAAFVLASDRGHYQQLPGWTAMDTEVPGARSVLAIAREGEAGAIVGSAVLRLRHRRGLPLRLAEVCGGPVAARVEVYEALLPILVDVARARRATRLVVTPRLEVPDAAGMLAALEAQGLTRREAPREPATLEVDLDPTPEAILAGFRKTTRYEVRRALKEGVTVEEWDGADRAAELQAIYDRMQEKGATPHPAPFFAQLFASLGAAPQQGFVLVAQRERQLVGGCVVYLFGRRALYAFGATDTRDGVPKGHLLMYEAMLAAKRRGARFYDLNGITEGTGTEGTRTAVQKVNVWKSGFGGRVVPLLPGRGVVLRPWLHRLEQLGGARPS